jgi:hypothetical protein
MTALSEALKRLLASEQALNASAFSQAQKKQLERFALDTRLVEINKHGSATVYRVVNRQSVSNYLRQLHPLDDGRLLASLPIRSRNIGTSRNSKKGQASHACFYLLMKAWDSEVVWQDEHTTLHPSKFTGRFGVAALQITAGQSWQCNRPLLLVENQALFDCCDWLPEGFNGCVAYYAGQLSDVLLNWFSEQNRTDTVILFPDYDGIGLANYVRLAESLHPDSILQFYWLPDWENKLVVYGNSEIWLKTRVQFENALQKLAGLNVLDDGFIRLGSLSQHYGKVLEQEAVWLPPVLNARVTGNQ